MKKLTITLIFFSLNAFASDHITLLIKEGLRNSFDVRSQKLNFEKNLNENSNSYAELLPTFTWSRGRTYSKSESYGDNGIANTDSRSDSMSVSANWTIWNNYSNIRNIQLADLSLDNSKLANKIAVQEYILNLLDSYLNYQLLLNDRGIQLSNVEQSQWNYDEAKAQATNGTKTKMDLVDSEIQLLNAKRSLVELKNQIVLAERRLNFVLNTKKIHKFEKIDMFKFMPYFENIFHQRFGSIVSNWKKRYRKENLAMLQAKNSLESNLTSLKQTKLNYWPQFSLSAAHEIDMSGKVNPETQENQRGNLSNSSISLNLTWQFWDWWATPRNVDNAKKDFQISRINFKQTKFQIKNEIQNIIDQYQMIKQSLKISRLTLKKASKQVEYSREMYRLGRTTLLRRQAAISNYISARNSLARRIKNEVMLKARLLAAMGETLIPEGVSLKWMNP
ncbi:TolC family protein [Bacteriovoracaceae bacterium]|nr:TolC family protein [Bacteriovoracaceae bacterium]